MAGLTDTRGSSLVVVVIEQIVPGVPLRPTVERFVNQIDFDQTLMLEALAMFAIREVVGGIGLGLALGYVGYRALKSIDDHPLELLITLALVMFLYSLSLVSAMRAGGSLR